MIYGETIGVHAHRTQFNLTTTTFEQCSELINDGSLSKAMWHQLNRNELLSAIESNAFEKQMNPIACRPMECSAEIVTEKCLWLLSTHRIRNWLDKGRNRRSMCAWWWCVRRSHISNRRSSIGCNEWDGRTQWWSTRVAHNWCTCNQNDFCHSQCDVVGSNDAAKWSHCVICERE